MLNVIMLNVIMLSVVAHYRQLDTADPAFDGIAIFFSLPLLPLDRIVVNFIIKFKNIQFKLIN